MRMSNFDPQNVGCISKEEETHKHALTHPLQPAPHSPTPTHALPICRVEQEDT